MAVYSDDLAGRGPFGNSTRWIQIAGALVALALIYFVMSWGYALVSRDVNGVPVVRALEGAMRVAPQDPGGDVSTHRGLSVNAIAAEGEAAPAEDRLVLAPSTGELAPEDLAAMPQPNLPADLSTGDATYFEDANQEPLTAQDVLALSAEEDTADAVSVENAVALAASLLDETSEAEANPLRVSASVPGVARSPRPAGRPGGLRAVAAAPAVAATQAAPSQDVAAPTATQGVAVVTEADLASGTPLLQLGAYDTAEGAASDWTRMTERFPDFLGDKDRVIQVATRNGRTFYRLRAKGFSDADDARRLCTALKAVNADCVPVVIR